MLSVSNLHFTYADGESDRPGGRSKNVLDGVDLELSAGSSVGLLGANGSGKSTLLGAITNSISGRCDADIHIDPEARCPIGYATQNVALYTHLSVRENLEHAARLNTRRWNVSDLVECAIGEFGLSDFVARQARKISGGQARIAHLACAFVHQPTIRLLDEPTTALDFQTRQRLIGLIQSWRSQGTATLVTAHYPEDIEELCEDLVVLTDGKTNSLGRVDDHLRALGVAATFSSGDTLRAIPVSKLTLRQTLDESAANGIELDDEFDSITVRPPRLRDLLEHDPSLRSVIVPREEVR